MIRTNLLDPGAWRGLVAELTVELEERTGLILQGVGAAVAHEAERSLLARQHALGTRTPASPGGPPAAISRTLAGSVVVGQLQSTGLGFTIRVGPAGGQVSSYGRTESSRYGAIHEHGRYPWLLPAAHRAANPATVAVIARAAFAGVGHGTPGVVSDLYAIYQEIRHGVHVFERAVHDPFGTAARPLRNAALRSSSHLWSGRRR